MRPLNQLIGAVLARLAGIVSGKHYHPAEKWACSLTPSGRSPRLLLPLYYDYRATAAGSVDYTAVASGNQLSYNLYSMSFSDGKPVAGEHSLSCEVPGIRRGDVLTVSLVEPSIALNGVRLSAISARHVEARKFIAEVQINAEGVRFSRLCSHYLPFDNKPVGSDYYFGDDYTDYPRQTPWADGVALVNRHGARGRLLDIGCALGIYTKAFLDVGFDAYGFDVSEFGISEAGKRVGAGRVRCASLDAGDIPFAGKFDVFWLWDVLEHFSAPEAALAKVTERANPGSLLFLHTSNADSLTHRIFSKDWEGYSDYSHYGVDQVTCKSLRAWVERLDWEIVEWECRNIWIEGVDPVVLRLKEVFGNSSELRVLLDELELGDAVRLVARKR